MCFSLTLQYVFGVRRDRVACIKEYTEEHIEQFKDMIRGNYKYKLYLDDLPSATVYRNDKN